MKKALYLLLVLAGLSAHAQYFEDFHHHIASNFNVNQSVTDQHGNTYCFAYYTPTQTLNIYGTWFAEDQSAVIKIDSAGDVAWATPIGKTINSNGGDIAFCGNHLAIFLHIDQTSLIVDSSYAPGYHIVNMGLDGTISNVTGLPNQISKIEETNYHLLGMSDGDYYFITSQKNFTNLNLDFGNGNVVTDAGFIAVRYDQNDVAQASIVKDDDTYPELIRFSDVDIDASKNIFVASLDASGSWSVDTGGYQVTKRLSKFNADGSDGFSVPYYGAVDEGRWYGAIDVSTSGIAVSNRTDKIVTGPGGTQESIHVTCQFFDLNGVLQWSKVFNTVDDIIASPTILIRSQMVKIDAAGDVFMGTQIFDYLSADGHRIDHPYAAETSYGRLAVLAKLSGADGQVQWITSSTPTDKNADTHSSDLFWLNQKPAWVLINAKGPNVYSGTSVNYLYGEGDFAIITLTDDSAANLNGPTLNSVVENTSTWVIDLAWDDNTSNEDGYIIWRKKSGSSWEAIDTVAINSTSYVDNDYDPSSTYTYKVAAFNHIKSTESNEIQVFTGAGPKTVTITSPAEGTMFLPNTAVSIDYTLFNVTFGKIEYDTNMSGNWVVVEAFVFTLPYSWTLPADIPVGTDVHIRVSDFIDPTTADTVNIRVDLPTGTASQAANREVQIFPNPSNGEVSFTHELQNIEIYNTFGKRVLIIDSVKDQESYLLNLDPGNYILKAEGIKPKMFAIH